MEHNKKPKTKPKQELILVLLKIGTVARVLTTYLVLDLNKKRKGIRLL